MGNGSGFEANKYALIDLTPTPFGFVAGYVRYKLYLVWMTAFLIDFLLDT